MPIPNDVLLQHASLEFIYQEAELQRIHCPFPLKHVRKRNHALLQIEPHRDHMSRVKCIVRPLVDDTSYFVNELEFLILLHLQI